MTAIPCPQAARAPGIAPPTLQPLENIVEDLPVLPRPPEQALSLPQALVDQAIEWPYHLPSFNGLDCLWWSMLVRSTYSTDAQWIQRVAGWAGPIRRFSVVGRTNPAVQGHTLVELPDCELIVIPGTSSELEALAYFVTHSLRLMHTAQFNLWRCNATWAARGAQVVASYQAWPPASPRKPVILVGHSSGGAYAAFTAYTLFPDTIFPATVVTFGAPIWGTPSMGERYFNLGKLPKTLDFGLPNDFVPTIPPPWAVIDLMRLQYPLADRPVYQRVNPLLALGDTSAPAPVEQQATAEVLTRAVASLITGRGFDVSHSTASYSAAAHRWAINDPSIAENRLTRALELLELILADMNIAGLY